MSIVHSIPSGELLHQGGEATLYKVKHGSRLYTLKLYNKGIAYDQCVVEDVAKIATTYAAKSGADIENAAGIYRIAEYGTVGGNAYILYDYIDGVGSRELSPMPIEFALHSLRQVVATLTALKKAGTSHGDLNPDNVFFDRDGNPVMIDFGIRGPGALNFSAPERIDGHAPSEKADLFSLGVLFFFWITGDTLFAGANFEEIQNAIRRADQLRPGEILFGKMASGLDINPETLSLLEPIWKRTITADPDKRAEDLEELDELLEIALNTLGGRGVRLSCLTEGIRKKISGILEKSGTKTLEKVVFPFFDEKKQRNSFYKNWILAAAVFIFLVITATYLFFARDKAPSVDDTGAALLQKSRSHEMELQDSVKMPDLEGVLKKLEPEESE